MAACPLCILGFQGEHTIEDWAWLIAHSDAMDLVEDYWSKNPDVALDDPEPV